MPVNASRTAVAKTGRYGGRVKLFDSKGQPEVVTILTPQFRLLFAIKQAQFRVHNPRKYNT